VLLFRALVHRSEAALVEPLRQETEPHAVEKQHLCPLPIMAHEKEEVPARVTFQSANAQREGTDDEKLKALAEYWRSTFFSELAGG
jgi:hypothetical protein